MSRPWIASLRGALLVCLVLVAGCASTPGTGPSTKGGGYYKDDGPGLDIPKNLHAIPNATPRIEQYAPANMRPYTVLGKQYIPLTDGKPFEQSGVASWYGKKFHGRKTANGETYDMYGMTAAHPTLPLPSYAKVTRPDTGQAVIVRINDRGPFHKSRVIDLSYAAAAKLGLIGPGSGVVVIEAITHEDIRQGRYSDSSATSVADRSRQADPPPSLTPVGEPDAIELLARHQLDNQTQQNTEQYAFEASNAITMAPLQESSSTPSLKPISGQSGEPQIYLQFGAFATEQNASALAARINQQARSIEFRDAHIEASNQLYRVQIGPYESRRDAVNAAMRLREQTGLDPTVAVR